MSTARKNADDFPEPFPLSREVYLAQNTKTILEMHSRGTQIPQDRLEVIFDPNTHLMTDAKYYRAGQSLPRQDLNTHMPVYVQKSVTSMRAYLETMGGITVTEQ